MSRPKISVIVPVHSDSDRLKRTLDSALAQTYDNIEVIVVSDAPSDDGAAEKIVESYGSEKIKFYKKENSGVASSLNFGIKKMTGQYFCWLSPGDVYDPEKTKKQVDSISGAADAIAVSDWTNVTGGGKKVRVRLADRRLEQYPGCFLAFARGIHPNTCAMLIPKEALKNSGLFDGSLPPAQDYKMLNRLITAGASFKIINQSLVRIGSRPKQEPSSGPTTSDYDFIYSDIINALSYEDIVGYFGHKEAAVLHYKHTLASGLPRTAAFLMAKIITGSTAFDGHDATKRILLDDLSMLTETEMATDAGTLLSRIAQPKSKKRILFCSAHWLTGGMERVMSTLFRELRNDYDILMITPYDKRKSYIDVPDFVTSIKIADDLFAKHFDSLILSYALLFDVDVAIGYMNMFEKQLNLYKLCAGTKIKTVASSHEYYFYPYKSPHHYNIVEKRLSAFGECDALVWPTNFSAALCGMYVDNNYVIGNPNNFEVVGPTDKAPRANIILCVGRFNDYVKRIDRMLECFSLVLQKVPDAKLVLVGKCDKNAPIRQGDNTTVNDLIRRLAIPPGSLNFVGEINNVQDYYAEAKVLMLTSNSEGFGMVLNEAACFGVPTVCNYIPGVEDIIVDGENGFITQQDDIESMAAKACDVLTDNNLWQRLSDSARKKVVAYDSIHIGNKWRHLLNMLIKTKDHDGWRQELDAELGYKIPDPQLFLRVVSGELNDIFYHATGGAGQHQDTGGGLLILSKIKRLPARLRANVEYEGWFKTGSKVVARSYRVARNILKV